MLAFLEKTEDPPTDQINAGTYVFNRDHRPHPAGREVSVEREVFPGLLAEGAQVCAYVDLDLLAGHGNSGRLRAGLRRSGAGLAPSPALGGRRGESLVHDGASVAPGAVLIGGTVGSRSGDRPGRASGRRGGLRRAKIEAGAVVERSIVASGARIGPRALLRDGIIGDGADIGARCELLRGARVWPGVVLPDCGIRYSSDI